jgi:hypothetical protein
LVQRFGTPALRYDIVVLHGVLKAVPHPLDLIELWCDVADERSGCLVDCRKGGRAERRAGKQSGRRTGGLFKNGQGRKGQGSVMKHTSTINQ